MMYKKQKTPTRFAPRKLGDIPVEQKYIKKKKPKPRVYKDKQGYTVIDIPTSITKKL